MARHIDAVCKLCRREGQKLFLKGERCLSPKCAIETRNFIPGDHGRKATFRRKTSDFGTQLREKQKARRIYGIMERQFRRYFKEANRRAGMTGATLLSMLESRLDNVIYQLGFAITRAQARQIVGHGLVVVNQRRVNIPSFQVKPGDVINIEEKEKARKFVKNNVEMNEGWSAPLWLVADAENLTGKVVRVPEREDIKAPVNEQLIVELYSR